MLEARDSNPPARPVPGLPQPALNSRCPHRACGTSFIGSTTRQALCGSSGRGKGRAGASAPHRRDGSGRRVGPRCLRSGVHRRSRLRLHRGLRSDARPGNSLVRGSGLRTGSPISCPVRGEGQALASGVPEEPPAKPSLADGCEGRTSLFRRGEDEQRHPHDHGSRPARPFRRAGPRGPTTVVGCRAPAWTTSADIREVVFSTWVLEAIGLTVDAVEKRRRGSREDARQKLRSRHARLEPSQDLPGVELCCVSSEGTLALSTLPIPLFSAAMPNTSQYVEAFASGADDYVAKPFRAPELRAASSAS